MIEQHQITYYEPENQPRALDITQPLAQKQPNSVVWVRLQNPDVTTLEHIVPQFVHQQRILEEMQTKHRRPKVVEYEGASLVVLVTFRVDQGGLSFGESQILFGEGFLISVWRGTTLNDQEVQDYLEDNLDLISRGADYIAAEILDFVTDDYTEQLLLLEKKIEKAEAHFFVGQSQKKDIEQVYNLRRLLLRIQSGISPLAELARRLTRQNLAYIGADSRAYFSEVADRIQRQAELIGIYRETLAFAFEGGMMIIQLQQNDITRKLAAWAAIIAIPTAVAGVYGMNFEYIPELSWGFGYPLFLGAMTGACTALYYRFKKMKWL